MPLHIDEQTIRDSSAERARVGITDAEIVALAGAFREYGFFRIDLDTGHFFGTSDICRIFGIEPTEGPISMVALVEHIHPDDVPLLMESFERVSSEQGIYHNIYRVKTANGYKFVRSVGQFRAREGSSGEVVGITYEFFERMRAIGYASVTG